MKKSLIAAAMLGAATMFSAPSFAEDVYFPIIAKGFSHQFWQAVKVWRRRSRQGQRRDHHL